MTVPLERSGSEPNNGKPWHRWLHPAVVLLVAAGIALPIVPFGGWEPAAIVFAAVLTIAPKGRDT
ncbi:hypothetical protein ACWIGW_44310 [Nocardia brasiliensis]